MGVLNVTPDSFSDGGAYSNVAESVDAAQRMADEGAAIIDVGGESTRPGSLPISLEEELHRVIPVVEGLYGRGLNISVDTSKSRVAEAALGAGATMINDVTALSDPKMADVCAKASCSVCLMHMKGMPANMQLHPTYDNVVCEVLDFLNDRAAFAQANGIAKDMIWIDPGIGFGKTDSHNLQLIREIGRFVQSGYPVLLGVSRKGFLGRLLAENEYPLPLTERMIGGLAIQAYGQFHGVSMVRTHDVKAAAQLAKTLSAISG
jgi:dihydropteroate synthase